MVLLLAAVLVLPALLWAAYVALRVATVGERDDQRPADAVVVLGTQEYSGWPSRSFSARLDHALCLYEEGMAPLVIVAGGGKKINPRLSFMYNPSPKGRSKLFSPLNEIYATIA
jgi:vancomycin permeability regulator SanA